MAHWFYTDENAVQQGPVEDSTLLDLNAGGAINARSLVWREGMPEWATFRSVAPALFAHATDPPEGADDRAAVEVGVCAHSGRVYPIAELLPYGEALVGPEHKETFVRRLLEEAAAGISDATEQPLAYVGFWWRALASTLDYLIKILPSMVLMIPYYVAAWYEGAPEIDEEEISAAALFGMGPMTLAAYGFCMLLMLGLSIAYDTWMVGRYQATLGKIIVGAKVVNPDGSRLTYPRAFWRWFVKKVIIGLIVWAPPFFGFAIVISLVIGAIASGNSDAAVSLTLLSMNVGFFVLAVLLALCSGAYWMAAFDPEKRTLHDRIAGTRVVRR